MILVNKNCTFLRRLWPVELKIDCHKNINRIFHPQVCQATKYSDNPQLVKWSADRFRKNKKEMEGAKIEEQESESHQPDALSFAPFFSQWHPPERNNPQHFPEDFLREFEKSIRTFSMNLVRYLDFAERIYFPIFYKKRIICAIRSRRNPNSLSALIGR